MLLLLSILLALLQKSHFENHNFECEAKLNDVKAGDDLNSIQMVIYHTHLENKESVDALISNAGIFSFFLSIF
jgi:short-subunit dehydrogenase